MQRREFFGTGFVGAGGVMGAVILPGLARAAGSGEGAAAPRLFEVTTTVELKNSANSAQLWLPVFQSAGGYQRLTGLSWETGAEARLVRDAQSGARILHARWRDPAVPRTVTLVQRVATWDRKPDDASPAVTGTERQFWTRPGVGVPTGGIVRDTARRIVGSARGPRDKARAIYDWVVANTWRDGSTAGCGDGNVEAMLRQGRMGGKCVDINRLFVALARAAGLPARDVYGLRLADSRRFKSLGRSGTVTGAQHCRAEVCLGDEGWVAMDPADVRKAVLEEKLAVDSAPILQLKEDLFGGWEGNWAGYNSASGIELAGANARPPFDFLMYPCAMGADGVVANCLDAGNFAYRITSVEVAA